MLCKRISCLEVWSMKLVFVINFDCPVLIYKRNILQTFVLQSHVLCLDVFIFQWASCKKLLAIGLYIRK